MISDITSEDAPCALASASEPALSVNQVNSRQSGQSPISSHIPTADLDLFATLPKTVRLLVLRRLRAMRTISRSGSVWSGCLAAARPNERGWSAKTLFALYTQFCESGYSWRVLVDCAKAGPSWQNIISAGGLPEAFKDHVASLWSRNQRDKFRPQYVKLIQQYRRWEAGDPTAAVPGYETCPEPDPLSKDDLPTGWSYDNLLATAKDRASDYARKNIQIGPKAASQLGPQVLTSRVGLKVGSYYFLDDSWEDAKVAAFRQTCRLLGFHALDYPSGCNVTRGHKPAVRDEETQAEQRLKEKEIIWLVVKLLTNEGYHPSGCTIACEKATATLRKREREILATMLGDTIRVHDGPAGGGPGINALFTGRHGGNPRWKAPLESWFNLLRNRTADMIEFPGQTGSNSRLNLPEGLAGTEQDVKALIKAAQILPPDQAEKLRLGLLPYTEAIFKIDAIIELINRRVDHNLQGWNEAGHYIEEFRTNMIGWSPTDQLLTWDIQERDMASAYLGSHPECRRTRPLSPREVFDAGRSELVKLPMAVAAMLMDETPGEEVPVRNNQLRLTVPEIDPSEPISFGHDRRNGQGTAEPLRNDEKYMVRVNPLDARVAWLYTATGKFAGVVDYYGRAGRTDTKALHAAFARKQKALATLTEESRRLAADITRESIARTDNNSQVFGPTPAHRARQTTAARETAEAHETLLDNFA